MTTPASWLAVPPPPSPTPRLPAGVLLRLSQRLDPHVHGVVDPLDLADLAGPGARIVRVGRAAYVARPDGLRWIFGVWDRRDLPPAWAPRLAAYRSWWDGRGPVPGPIYRREGAWLRGFMALRLTGPTGRDLGPVPYWMLLPRDLWPWRLT